MATQRTYSWGLRSVFRNFVLQMILFRKVDSNYSILWASYVWQLTIVHSYIVDGTPKWNDAATFHLFSHVYAEVRYSSSSIWSSCCTYCIQIFLIISMRLLGDMMERNFSHDSELLVPYYSFSLLKILFISLECLEVWE